MRVLILLGSLICFSASVYAADIKLVTGDQYPPFTGKKLLNRGVATDIIEAAFKGMKGVSSVDIAFQPWKRGYDSTLKGQYFATFPYLKTPEREKDFLFSEAVFTTNTVAFVAKGSTLSVDNLKGTTACLPLGYTASAIQHLIDDKTVRLTRAKQLENCFQKLKAGRADFVPLSRLVGIAFINDNKKLDLKDFDSLAKPFTTGGLFLMASKNYPDVQTYLDEFNKQIKTMKDSGSYNEIMKKHGLN